LEQQSLLLLQLVPAAPQPPPDPGLRNGATRLK
jgi:hypothetical protein